MRSLDPNRGEVVPVISDNPHDLCGAARCPLIQRLPANASLGEGGGDGSIAHHLFARVQGSPRPVDWTADNVRRIGAFSIRRGIGPECLGRLVADAA
jgi:hypothetical protein